MRGGLQRHHCRRQQVRPRAAIELVVVGNDVVADLHAFIADEHRGAGNQLADVVLVLVAERAAEDFVLAGLLLGHYFPGGFAPADPPTRSLAGAPCPAPFAWLARSRSLAVIVALLSAALGRTLTTLRPPREDVVNDT